MLGWLEKCTRSNYFQNGGSLCRTRWTGNVRFWSCRVSYPHLWHINRGFPRPRSTLRRKTLGHFKESTHVESRYPPWRKGTRRTTQMHRYRPSPHCCRSAVLPFGSKTCTGKWQKRSHRSLSGYEFIRTSGSN